MKKFDIILIISIFIISFTAFGIWYIKDLTYEGVLYCNVYYCDDCVLSEKISNDNEYIIKGDISNLTVVVKNDRVYVKESGCENQICVNTGKIKKKGQTIVCAPNKVWVTINSKEGVVDES